MDSRFSHRTLEKNWQKYDMEKESNELDYQGADYVELVQSTSHILPEFQFRYNTTNEDSGSFKQPDTIVNDPLARYLSLECDSLTDILTFVPVYKHLDLDIDLFEESHVEQLTTDCRPNVDTTCGAYTHEPLQANPTTRNVVSTRVESSYDDNTTKQAHSSGTSLQHSDTSLSTVDSSAVVSDKKKTAACVSSSNSLGGDVREFDHGERNSCNSKCLSELECELDELLAL